MAVTIYFPEEHVWVERPGLRSSGLILKSTYVLGWWSSESAGMELTICPLSGLWFVGRRDERVPGNQSYSPPDPVCWDGDGT